MSPGLSSLLVPQNPHFTHSWDNTTTVDPIGLVVLGIMMLCLLLLPKAKATLPIILLACLIPAAQRIVVFGLDFSFLRLMILTGWTRFLIRNELRRFRWLPLDTVIIAWKLAGIILFTLQQRRFGAFIYQCGTAFDLLGIYFFFRIAIPRWDQIRQSVQSFLIISIPALIPFLIERATGRNLFAFMGGVPEQTMIRNGRLRCQGAFPHPIIAGCFFATLLPIYASLLFRKGANTFLIILGVISTILIVVNTASSTPAMALIAGFLAFSFIPLRPYLSLIRIGAVLMLTALHFYMKGPVWSLLARVDLSGGSTGYHRYMLVDQFIRRFSEWALWGTPSTEHWGYFLFDTANQYVAEGTGAGLLNLLLFLWIFVLAFRYVGRAWRFWERDRERFLGAWGFGAALFTHMVAFIGVAYFGQISVVLFFQLAVVANFEEERQRLCRILPAFSFPVTPTPPRVRT